MLLADGLVAEDSVGVLPLPPPPRQARSATTSGAATAAAAAEVGAAAADSGRVLEKISAEVKLLFGHSSHPMTGAVVAAAVACAKELEVARQSAKRLRMGQGNAAASDTSPALSDGDLEQVARLTHAIVSGG